jgi:hypothetical protein
METPDYVRILKLDKIAMKSKTQPEYLVAAEARRPFARTLGVEWSFAYFVEQAWTVFGDGTGSAG